MEDASLQDLQVWARAKMQRPPDFVIGDPEKPYMRRWFVAPRNPFCNVYLHQILRSDDDRAGHDHPWDNRTLVIEGGYDEILFGAPTPWQESGRVQRQPGDIVDRVATDTHRLIVPDGREAISLFMTGPRLREWGFWCADGERWVHYKDFTAGPDGALVGKGCDG
jgi:hypothetical protein